MPKTKQKTSKAVVRVTLATFDSDRPDPDGGTAPIYRPAFVGVPIKEVREFGPGDYQPYGATPLRDASMRLIHTLDGEFAKAPNDIHIGLLADESGSMSHNQLAVVESMNEFLQGMVDVESDDAGGRVLAVILTDGLENASREVSPEALRSATSEREGTGKWTFLYLGANQDAWAAASSSGLPSAQGAYFNYVSTDAGTRSALKRAGARAQSFVSDSGSYAAMASSEPDTIGEDGSLSDSGAAAPPPSTVPPVAAEKPKTYGSVEEALKRAKSR